jgi:spermidine/putrescine transport system permease protein
MEYWQRNKRLFAGLIGLPLFWLVVFFTIPMLIVWAYSFGETVGLTEIVVNGTLGNYARALDPLFLGVFARSMAIAALVTGLCLIIGYPIAFFIAFAPKKWRAPLLLLIMLPFLTNLMIRTFALMTLLRTQGVANGVLGWAWGGLSSASAAIGFGPLEPWQPLELLFNEFAVILGLVYIHLPFMVLPLYVAIERIDRSLIEASLDLGAGHWTTLNRIVVPLTAPGIWTGLIITFIPALGSYLTPDLMGGTSSQMIANLIERQFKRANDWPMGAALSFLLIYATIALYAVQALRSRYRGRNT